MPMINRYTTKPNLNVVSQSDLTKLHGFGVKTAEAVVKYRKENGPFRNFDELLKIPNIGPKRREILLQNFTITSTTKKANSVVETFSLKNKSNDQFKERYATKPNLNVVSQSDLIKLHGIGVKTAEAVVKYRKENGPFRNFDELLKIPNIGPKRLEILLQNFIITSTTKKANSVAKTFSLKNKSNDRSKGRCATKPNLNVVSQSDLTKLHGIGVKTAQAVVKYRKENGPFQDFDELLKIPNVGPKRLEILQQNFTITDPDRGPSSTTSSSQHHENHYSADPGKTSITGTQSQSRTFSLFLHRFNLLTSISFRTRLFYFISVFAVVCALMCFSVFCTSLFNTLFPTLC